MIMYLCDNHEQGDQHDTVIFMCVLKIFSRMTMSSYKVNKHDNVSL